MLRRVAADRVTALCLLAVLAFVLLITVPYLGQPIHLDDAIFWDFAHTDLNSPLQLHIPDYNLMGQNNAAFRDSHPPLDQYYQSVIMRVTGGSEAMLHLGFMVFPLMAGVSMFFLARRFTRNALLAVLLLLATPAVMTMSHTLMGDMPLLSLWLAATACYVFGVDGASQRLLGASAVFSLLAVLTGYQALALVLLFPLYAALNRKLSWRTVWPVLAPLAAFGLYCLYSLGEYGALPRFKHAGGLSLESARIAERLQGTLLQMGGASIFPLGLIAVFLLKRGRPWLLPVTVLAGAVLAYVFYASDFIPVSSALLFFVFISAAGLAIAGIAIDGCGQLAKVARRQIFDGDRLFLTAWFFGMIVMVVTLLPHATAKYTLPFLAPLVLLVVREIDALRMRRLLVYLAVPTVALTLLTGFVVSAADNRLAQSDRDFAMRFSDLYQPQGDVWFVGEWGFRHYMEQQGFRYLTSGDDSPREGDLIVRAEFSDWPLSEQVLRRMQLEDVNGKDWDVPVRVMNFRSSAGFYGSHWGALPYAFSSEPLQKYEIYRIGSEEPTQPAI